MLIQPKEYVQALHSDLLESPCSWQEDQPRVMRLSFRGYYTTHYEMYNSIFDVLRPHFIDLTNVIMISESKTIALA